LPIQHPLEILISNISVGAELNNNSKPLEMKQIFYSLFFLMVISIPHQALSQSGNSSQSLIAPLTIKLESFAATEKNKKIYLEWAIIENKAVDHFEVERSIDGRKFSTAALVLGSEEAGKEIYKFFEASPNGNAIYRLKMFGKNSNVEYSEMLFLKKGI